MLLDIAVKTSQAMRKGGKKKERQSGGGAVAGPIPLTERHGDCVLLTNCHFFPLTPWVILGPEMF